MTENDSDTRQGVVFRRSTGRYWIRAGQDVVSCTISSTLRKSLVYPTAAPTSVRRRVVRVDDIATVDPVAIGDEVAFRDAGEGMGMIVEILPRRNKLSRRAAGPKSLEQVIVANVDQMVAVFSASRPDPKWGLLDRYLADAEWAGIPAVICFTKLDLVNEGTLADEIGLYTRIGYPVILTSAATGQGMDTFENALVGRVSVLVGKSGVGKTTLLNALQPGLNLPVNEVGGSSGKGRHTTSHLEMFTLDCGGSVVDTPGMREFALWDIDRAGLVQLFPEMRSYIGECRFGVTCSHTHEPGCAVKVAVETGDVAYSRYRSFLDMTGQGAM